jgi:hypothetical protein
MDDKNSVTAASCVSLHHGQSLTTTEKVLFEEPPNGSIPFDSYCTEVIEEARTNK